MRVFRTNAQVCVFVASLCFGALCIIFTSGRALAGVLIAERPGLTHDLCAVHLHICGAEIFALIGHAIVCGGHVHGGLGCRADRVDALFADKTVSVCSAGGGVRPATLEQCDHAKERQQPEGCGFHDIRSRDRSIKGLKSCMMANFLSHDKKHHHDHHWSKRVTWVDRALSIMVSCQEVSATGVVIGEI